VSSHYGVFERLNYSRENDAVGSAYGIDLHTIYSIPGFYSWISYGLLYANENSFNDTEAEYPRYTDQRHTVSFVANIGLGNNWDFSFKANYGSGFPTTPRLAKQEDETDRWYWEIGKPNSESLPAYKRVDLKLTKSFTYSNMILTTFIDISNVFNFKNVQSYEYDEPGLSKPSKKEVELWPIVPSFGIRVIF